MAEYITPGTRIGVTLYGVVRHEGVVTDAWFGNEQGVASRSRRARRAVEEPLSKFAAGGQVEILPPLSDLHPSLVVQNARRLLDTPWQLLDANCEHFVHECFGLEPQSPQLQVLAAIAGTAAVLFMLSR